jgi:Tfp pilus assembly protein PilF
MNRLLDDVVETLQKAKVGHRKCTLLIGAGCSVKAGIPTAVEFVEIIRTEFPNAYKRAVSKTYPSCMSELAVGERRELIARYVDSAKLNWAHIAIAQLMKAGYIDRVLTTNFDLLVVRACALLAEFPAIYDFAASQLFQGADIPDQAVFYLHGQRTGFVLMNTASEVERHSKLLKPVFDDAGRGRVWLVVGYSGINDPVFDHLANVPRFDWNLFWVGYKDNPPAPHISEKLLLDGKYAFYVEGYDADDFFVSLAQRLGVFPPGLFGTPFTHLKTLLETVAPYTLPGQSTAVDVTDDARKLIQIAIDKHEGPGRIESIATRARKLMLEGKYDEVVAIRTDGEANSPELSDTIAWAFIGLGNEAAERARTRSGEEADKLFSLAGEKYAAALTANPDKHEAFNNWGNALLDQATTKTGPEADELFELAGEKYAAALSIKADKHEALYNWATALSAQAVTKRDKEADALFAKASEKYAAALAVKPDKHEALNNWGYALCQQARTKRGDESDKLFALAGEKYAAALSAKPDKHDAVFNWGNALSDQAKTKSGEEADILFRLAIEKYAAALAIKPDKHDALNNWGTVLAEQATTKTGEEAESLLAAAGEKYAAALAIKPDKHEALCNWGNALFDQAKTKSGEEADKLFEVAMEKYAAAAALRPDKPEILRNWGNAFSEQAKTKSGQLAAKLRQLAQQKWAAAKKLQGGKHDRAF